MTYSNGVAGLLGWQWMFIAEGVPTVLLGVFTLYYLTDRPADAAWLAPAQREWLQSELRTEIADLERHGRHRLINSIRDRRVWLLGTLFGCALVGIYGMLMWLPQIIKSLGKLTDIQIGFFVRSPSSRCSWHYHSEPQLGPNRRPKDAHRGTVHNWRNWYVGECFCAKPDLRLCILVRRRPGHQFDQFAFLELERIVHDRRRGSRFDRCRQYDRPIWRACRALANRVG